MLPSLREIPRFGWAWVPCNTQSLGLRQVDIVVHVPHQLRGTRGPVAVFASWGNLVDDRSLEWACVDPPAPRLCSLLTLSLALSSYIGLPPFTLRILPLSLSGVTSSSSYITIPCIPSSCAAAVSMYIGQAVCELPRSAARLRTLPATFEVVADAQLVLEMTLGRWVALFSEAVRRRQARKFS